MISTFRAHHLSARGARITVWQILDFLGSSLELLCNRDLLSHKPFRGDPLCAL